MTKCRGAYYGPIYNGIRMTYRPLDPDDFNFRSAWQWTDFATLSTSEQGTIQAQLTSNTINTANLTSTAEVPHYMIFYVDPNSGNLPSFNISITLNYEGLPKSDEIGAEMGGVYCDPVSLAYGLNMAANQAQCTSASEAELAKIERLVSTL